MCVYARVRTILVSSIGRYQWYRAVSVLGRYLCCTRTWYWLPATAGNSHQPATAARTFDHNHGAGRTTADRLEAGWGLIRRAAEVFGGRCNRSLIASVACLLFILSVVGCWRQQDRESQLIPSLPCRHSSINSLGWHAVDESFNQTKDWGRKWLRYQFSRILCAVLHFEDVKIHC